MTRQFIAEPEAAELEQELVKLPQPASTGDDGTRPRLIVNCDGGLGNQMFEYAAGIYFARTFSRGLEVLRPVAAQQQWNGYSRPFQLSKFHITAPVRGAGLLDRLMISRSKWAKCMRGVFECTLGIQVLSEPKAYFYQPEMVGVPSRRRAYMVGYWQSSAYVEAVAHEIRTQFTLRHPLQSHNSRYAELIADLKCAVSVHIRLGDYTLIQHKVDGNKAVSQVLPARYYERALAVLQEAVGDACTLIVFSDDPVRARDIVKNLPSAVFVEGNDASTAHEEMYLMSLCRHHIIANSSFSWWGAWLNNKPGKKVIAPRYWGNTPNSYFPDIYPLDWQLIDNL